MKTIRFRCFWLIVAIAMAMPAIADDATNQFDTLIKEKRSLEFNMAKIRVSLLQQNEELRELNERIIKLQKLLTKKLHDQAEIKFVQNKIDKIDAQLESYKSGVAGE